MERFKKIWFVFLMALLSIPMLQNLSNLVEEKPLNGAYIPAVRPRISLKSIWDETCQDSIVKYFDENIGFHNTFIRLNNQFIFSLFRESPIKGPVYGKENMFFEESYIVSYIGQTYIGDSLIKQNSLELFTAQEIMKNKNVKLIVLFMPGKASYFPELIPDKYDPKKMTINNYLDYKNKFDNIGINYLDFNSYICDMKDTATKAIYCNLSAHWTVYAAALSMDTLLRYMENDLQKNIVDFSITGFDSPDTLRGQDDALYKTMNLMFIPKHNKIQYPIFQINDGDGRYKPKVLAIADSYWWTVYAHDVALPQRLFSNGGFWFYNKTIYPVRDPVQNVDGIDYFAEINQQEYVLLVTTEATNHIFPFDFCDKYLIGYEKEFSAKNPEE